MTSLTPTALPIGGHSDYDRRNDMVEMAADDYCRDPETSLAEYVEGRIMLIVGRACRGHARARRTVTGRRTCSRS